MRKKALFLTVGAFAVLSLLLATSMVAAGASSSGAIFTTNSSCGGTNVNVFSSKSDVYLDGGPEHGGAAGLPDGYYFVQVTTPSGDTLGKTNSATVHVTSGSFDQCYQLVDILYSASSSFTSKGFDDTTNTGGEYKVWISQNSSFPNDASKTDNFKVSSVAADLKVIKFYDANADGINNDSQSITGWKVNILDDVNWDRYTPVDMVLAPDTYTVSEYIPNEPNWIHTTAQTVTVTLSSGEEKTVEFGNVCLGPGGGHTLGFWSNKNGQNQFQNWSGSLTLLKGLNLRNAEGGNFDPSTYQEFRTWLLGANATNMAYMLSAQLAAMELNVQAGLVSSSAIVYAPGVVVGTNFVTISDLMNKANQELGDHGSALSGDEWRSYQEALKNALDAANNNTNFVQSTSCPFSFPE